MSIRLATPDDYDAIRQVEVAAYHALAEMYERMGFVADRELPLIAGLRAWRYRLPLTPEE